MAQITVRPLNYHDDLLVEFEHHEDPDTPLLWMMLETPTEAQPAWRVNHQDQPRQLMQCTMLVPIDRNVVSALIFIFVRKDDGVYRQQKLMETNIRVNNPE